jgi:hypothetical protein
MSLEEIAWILVGATVVGALAAWRAAPAVTVALGCGLVGAVIAYDVAGTDGPSGVPSAVAFWFSVGLLLGAISGAALTRRRNLDSWSMARAAVVVLLLTPFACVALTFALQEACPLYVQQGLCDFEGTDQLGGWITFVVFLAGVDLLVIAGLLLFAPGPRKRGDEHVKPV